MRLAIQTPLQHTTFGRLHDLWQVADRTGFAAAFTYDHLVALGSGARPGAIGAVPDGSQLEGWTTLAALAAATSNLEVGTLATGVTYRPVAVLAKMAVTLDVITGGRAILGVGAGWHETEHDMIGLDFPPVGQRMRLLEETVESFGRLCATHGRVDYDGAVVKLRGMPFEPKPVRPSGIPVLIGGSGARLRSIAARRADIYNGFWPPTQWPEINADLDDRLRQADRSSEALQRSVFVQTELSSDPATQDQFVAEVMATRGGSAAEVRSRCLVGSDDAMADVLGSYQAAGVDMAVLSIGPTTRADDLERFAREVMTTVTP